MTHVCCHGREDPKFFRSYTTVFMLQRMEALIDEEGQLVGWYPGVLGVSSRALGTDPPQLTRKQGKAHRWEDAEGKFRPTPSSVKVSPNFCSLSLLHSHPFSFFWSWLKMKFEAVNRNLAH